MVLRVTLKIGLGFKQEEGLLKTDTNGSKKKNTGLGIKQLVCLSKNNKK